MKAEITVKHEIEYSGKYCKVWRCNFATNTEHYDRTATHFCSCFLEWIDKATRCPACIEATNGQKEWNDKLLSIKEKAFALIENTSKEEIIEYFTNNLTTKEKE